MTGVFRLKIVHLSVSRRENDIQLEYEILKCFRIISNNKVCSIRLASLTGTHTIPGRRR